MTHNEELEELEKSIKKAQKDCPRCIHKDLCFKDRRVCGYVPMISPMLGTFEERQEMYLKGKEEMSKPCSDFIDMSILEKETTKSIPDTKYKKAWAELKDKLLKELAYRKSGEMQSLTEAINCEAECRKILDLMSQLEGDIAD